MKSILFFAIIIFSTTSLFGQNYNEIIFENTFINNVPLGASKIDVIRCFGKPQKIVKDKDVSEDGRWSNYFYKNSIIMISAENTFRGFTIIDSSFIISYNEIDIKIGDDLSKLQKYFPQSYNMQVLHGGNFQLSFKNKDSFIVLILKNCIITEMQTWENI